MSAPTPSAEIVLDGTIRKLDPKVRTWWVIRRGVLWLALMVLWLVIAVVGGEFPLAVAGPIVLAVIVAIVFASAILSYRYWSWSAHHDAIEIRHGVVYRHYSVVPHHRIQQIDIERGPVERLLGIATLVLRSAAATTDARIPGIAVEHSEVLRHALLERVGADDAV